MTVRRRIEASFEDLGHAIVRAKWLILLIVFSLTAALGSLAPQVRVDNSNEVFLHENDPVRIDYDAFQERFGREDRINLIFEAEDLFDLAFLEKLREIHSVVESELPYVEDVTSLINARDTRGIGDELVVEDLFENWPETEAELAAIKQRALANPLYENVLLSENADFTMISIKPFTYSALADDDALAGFDSGDAEDEGAGGVVGARAEYLTEPESYELVQGVRAIAERYSEPGKPIHVIGGPVVDHALSDVMNRDTPLSFALALGVMISLLAILFRRVSGVVLPLVVVVSAVVSSVGCMVLLGIPFSITLNILPAFLLVVGICDSIHILVLVYQRLAAGVPRDEAIAQALGHSGLAVVMTSITTAAGLMSFVVADLAPIMHVGIIAPIGIMLAMLYSLFLLPSLLAVMPLAAKASRVGQDESPRLAAFLAKLGDISTRHPLRVVGVTVAIGVLGLGGIVDLRFSHDGVRWFPEEDPLRVAAELIDREFQGGNSLEAVLDTGRENGLHDPELLNQIETIMREAEARRIGDIPVAKALSIVDVLKETHQALNENDAAYYRIPQERQLVAQELLLFENSGTDDLEELTDSQLSLSRITMRTPWVDGMLYPVFVDGIDELFRENLGEDVEYSFTGGAVIYTRIYRAVILSMARSYVIAFIVIAPLLILLVGNLKRGMLAMIPNLLPIYLALCLMGYLDIPLDISTLLIGGILLGVAVDDTIHFMHKFNRYYEDLGDPVRAVHETLMTTGAALLFTSLVLALGFSVFLSAYLSNIQWFGLLTAVSTVVAFFADVMLGPALMVLATRNAHAAKP